MDTSKLLLIFLIFLALFQVSILDSLPKALVLVVEFEPLKIVIAVGVLDHDELDKRRGQIVIFLLFAFTARVRVN